MPTYQCLKRELTTIFAIPGEITWQNPVKHLARSCHPEVGEFGASKNVFCNMLHGRNASPLPPLI